MKTKLYKELRKVFTSNLDLVKEERPHITLSKQVSIANSYTVEEIEEIIGRIADNRKYAHIDCVNKFHFDLYAGIEG